MRSLLKEIESKFIELDDSIDLNSEIVTNEEEIDEINSRI